jgi:hypothetical protein
LRKALHSNKKTTALSVTSRPFFDVFVELLPAAKIEVSNAKVGSVRDCKSGFERWEKLLVNVVKNPRHRTRFKLSGDPRRRHPCAWLWSAKPHVLANMRYVMNNNILLCLISARACAEFARETLSRHYSTRDFFRQMPNRQLARYFAERGALAGLDFYPERDVARGTVHRLAGPA